MTAWLQFSVSSVFVHFMQKLLETTQVSQSVIVLSLHYIYRLKERNCATIPYPGSEFRVAVAGLMMANKFVDEYALFSPCSPLSVSYVISVTRTRTKRGPKYLESS